MGAHSKSVFRYLLALLLVSGAGPAAAHHSYADFNLEQNFEIRGVLTAVHWANPHILLTVSSGNTMMRVEWVTTVGADVTGVSPDQFSVGDRITIIGSRHRNPDTYSMARVMEIRLDDKNWLWQSPESQRRY